MPIQVSCEGCGSRINAPNRAAGRSAPCPNCGRAIQIPPSPATAPPPPVIRAVRVGDSERADERTKTAERVERPEAVPWYKTPGGAAGIFVGVLLAGGSFLTVAALAIQLADSRPKVDPSKMGPSEYKTVEQAREELQSRIDRYLGGQRDPNTFNLDFALWSAAIKVSNIEIVRVGPRVNEVGGIVPNTFTAVLRCSAETEKFGANLATKEITIKYLSYERGQWTIPK